MAPAFNILLAEDDPNDQLLFHLAFAKAGCEGTVYTVDDGDRAISYLSGNPPYSDRERYPAISMLLLDLRMPRRDGFSVLEWLFWRPNLRPEFVGVFSSVERPEDRYRAMRLGADSFLVKPQDPSGLIHLIKGLNSLWGKRDPARYAVHQREQMIERHPDHAIASTSY